MVLKYNSIWLGILVYFGTKDYVALVGKCEKQWLGSMRDFGRKV